MSRSSREKGFTLIELLVSVSIFVFMTALLVAKYGNFNQSVLLTNLAYDVALTIRTAQTYGLSVQGRNAEFQYAYGVDFCALSAGCPEPPGGTTVNNRMITLFADSDGRGGYDNSDFFKSHYAIKRGAKILGFCFVVAGCTEGGVIRPMNIDNSIKRVDITFMRPNPDAIICRSGSEVSNDCVDKSGPTTGPQPYVKIIVQAPDGSRRGITVRRTGQVSVEN